MDPGVRLYCFSYAGGSASIYRSWAEVFPPDIEVHCVQLPGREWRLKEEPFTRLGPLMDELVEVVDVTRPYALFGHSLGALIAFELARAMRRTGRPDPTHLFVSAHRAPQLPREEPTIHDADDDVFAAGIETLRGTPPELLANEELMQLIRPVLRADFALAETYEYSDEPPLRCPISAFGGLGDHVTGRSKLEPWRAQTSSDFLLRMILGGHFFVTEARDLVLRAVFQDLMGALRPTRG
jgi:medium-chain acyl-[acyl-carrier-protein] hydrolase